MKLTVAGDAETVAERGADVLAEVVEATPAAVLGLPTGRTMVPLYAELRRRHDASRIDLSRARGFNLDELVLPVDHPASFASYMERHAWERIGLDRSRCDIPGGEASLYAECRRYDAALAEAGPFDLLILGVGADGHVAYNLPGTPVERTHVVELGEQRGRSFEVPPEWRPLRAITIGFGPMHAARRIVLLATGPRKAAAARALLHGPVSPRWPCTLLRHHADFEVIVDRELAERADVNVREADDLAQ